MGGGRQGGSEWRRTSGRRILSSLCLGPWYKAGVIYWPCSVNTLLSFGDLVEDFLCLNQCRFPDLRVCGVDQVRLISFYKLHNFQLYCSLDKVDNCATIVGHTEFGLLSQLV